MRKIKKRRKIVSKNSNINITEIIGYLNSNLDKDVKPLDPNLKGYLDTLGQSKLNSKPTLNLNELQVNVKNFTCDISNGGCSQLCSETSSIKCACFKGFKLSKNQRTCIDINECLVKNAGCSHTCVNIHGSYYCTCPEGLRLGDDYKICKDVNECMLRNGHGPCQDVCQNTFGSYKCSCSIVGTQLGSNKHSCEDIDECFHGTSGCTHGCINIIGGAVCTCPIGLVLKDDLKTCDDLDQQKDEVPTLCPNLVAPNFGYFLCHSKKPLEYYNTTKITIPHRSGVICDLVCLQNYKTVGDYRVLCAANGHWYGNQTGKCLLISDRSFDSRKNFIKVTWAYSKPRIKCPPPLSIQMKEDENVTYVRLSPPKTNVNWRNVKSIPAKVKQTMEVYLPQGHHWVIFEAKNPVANLTASCIVSIIINRENDV
ncbi:hypothetical protein FQA39_LY05650 [Lamprigera yunnana]|nr:hypothetical protein FQA39_LY05650 [Lamprigera yunnana]